MQPILNRGKVIAPTPPKPKAPPKKLGKAIKIKRVTNCLPYSCLVEIECPSGCDNVYYAALDDDDKKLFYKSAYPANVLPAFSMRDFKAHDKTPVEEFRFVCWPVKKGKIGNPTYYGPISSDALKLGTYDLDVAFEGDDLQLFQQVKPIIEKYYGKAALPGTIKVIDNPFDIYIPSENLIKLSPNRHNLIHELIHANRKQMLFAWKDGRYHEGTEMIEEFFAEGVSHQVKNELNQEPNSHLKAGEFYGSTMGYNYDFRITDPSLGTQNLQSTSGGIYFLENSRYQLVAAAFHKIAMEYHFKTGKHFGKAFNKLYYSAIFKRKIEPDKELFFSLCEKMIKKVEGIKTRKWLSQQIVFDCDIVQGEKIFMDFHDYPMHDEWIGICNISLYETFKNGSDWMCGKLKHRKNGKPINISIKNVTTGQVLFEKKCIIANNDKGFGYVKIFFYHKDNSPGVAHFGKHDQQYQIAYESVWTPSALYEIKISTKKTTRIYHRVMGEIMLTERDKFIFANLHHSDMSADMKLQISHQSVGSNATKTTSQIHSFENNLCVVDVPYIENTYCDPGILTINLQSKSSKNKAKNKNKVKVQSKIQVKDKAKVKSKATSKGKTTTQSKTQTIQRNIGYGGLHGGHQFLLKEVVG